MRWQKWALIDSSVLASLKIDKQEKRPEDIVARQRELDIRSRELEEAPGGLAGGSTGNPVDTDEGQDGVIINLWIRHIRQCILGSVSCAGDAR